jgi:hypothetical protein
MDLHGGIWPEEVDVKMTNTVAVEVWRGEAALPINSIP